MTQKNTQFKRENLQFNFRKLNNKKSQFFNEFKLDFLHRTLVIQNFLNTIFFYL